MCQPLPSITQIDMLFCTLWAHWIDQSARLPEFPYAICVQNHTIGMVLYHRDRSIPYQWNHTIGMVLYHGDRSIPYQQKHTNETIPYQWNHTIPMKPYHTNGIIPYQWNHTIPMKSYHTNGIIPEAKSYHTIRMGSYHLNLQSCLQHLDFQIEKIEVYLI